MTEGQAEQLVARYFRDPVPIPLTPSVVITATAILADGLSEPYETAILAEGLAPYETSDSVRLALRAFLFASLLPAVERRLGG